MDETSWLGAEEAAMLGMAPAAAERALDTLGLDDSDVWLSVIAVLRAAASPARALKALVRTAERRPPAWQRMAQDQRLLARAAMVAGSSGALGDLLADDELAVELLASELEPWSAAAVTEAVSERFVALDEPDDAVLAHTLAGVQRRGLLRIAARDLLGMSDTSQAAAELSDLADGVFQGVLDLLLREAGEPLRLAVIGMGKLGGRELNYVSDVDVVFVAEGKWGTANRVAERFLRLLGRPTPLGRVYEVDANLRPEGRDGPLVRTLEAYEAYYERWASTWEFQALLKARHAAGDAELGAAFEELVSPFVWPDRRSADAIAEIQRMKGQVERSRAVQRAGARQVKLAPGGLRDIEFAVQLLQLVHGRHDPSLRSRTTLDALTALASGGYVDEGDANLFGDAYQFLRTVEHRLQLVRLRRTHVVPSDPDDRVSIARGCGFRELASMSALEQFDRELARVQGYVRRLHEKLFYRPLLTRFAELSAGEQLGRGDGFDRDAARERLDALGFAAGDRALADIDAMIEGVGRTARLLRNLLPTMLPVLASAPAPDKGLTALRSMAERLEHSPYFANTLRDAPPAAETLATVLGCSTRVGGWLERQPEVLTMLAETEQLAEPLTPEQYGRTAAGLLRRGSEPTRTADALRRFRRREAARIAVRDVTGRAGVEQVGYELTGLAAACLEAALALAVDGRDVRLAIIGLGKLGARELGYASDLDITIVYAPAERRDDALAAAERLRTLLGGITPEGQAFKVDLGLRPEGKDGPLTRSLDSYRQYWERWAETWELQALTQGRPVAGDTELGEAFCQAAAEHVFASPAPPSRVQDVRKMKARVERERSSDRRPRAGRRPGGARSGAARDERPGSGRDERIDVKLGAGGLADVEWTLQLLQLQHGGASAALRRPGVLHALRAGSDAGLISDGDAARLEDSWRLCSRIRNALYLMGARKSDVVPSDGSTREHLAALLSYDAPGGQAMVEDLRRVLRRARRTHEQLFYP
ncbi:MAG: bifunctional [glutamine synthetase] adenylyltransferase/[glutamine synthetase]-adenylyl-L-tyrosine phosphorylase [Egibacteraceae bacterium]